MGCDPQNPSTIPRSALEQAYLPLDQETLFSHEKLEKTVSYIGAGLGDTFGSRRSEFTRATFENQQTYPEVLWIKSGEPWVKPRHQSLAQGLDQ